MICHVSHLQYMQFTMSNVSLSCSTINYQQMHSLLKKAVIVLSLEELISPGSNERHWSIKPEYIVQKPLANKYCTWLVRRDYTHTYQKGCRLQDTQLTQLKKHASTKLFCWCSVFTRAWRSVLASNNNQATTYRGEARPTHIHIHITHQSFSWDASNGNHFNLMWEYFDTRQHTHSELERELADFCLCGCSSATLLPSSHNLQRSCHCCFSLFPRLWMALVLCLFSKPVSLYSV